MTTTTVHIDGIETLERANELLQMELFDGHRFGSADLALSGSASLYRDDDRDRELLDELTLGVSIVATLANGYELVLAVVGRSHAIKDTSAGGVANVAKTTLKLLSIRRPDDDDEPEGF